MLTVRNQRPEPPTFWQVLTENSRISLALGFAGCLLLGIASCSPEAELIANAALLAP